MDYKEYKPDDMSLKQRHQTLIGGIGPRPIALVGSIDSQGGDNLAPFSFFNAFSSNPAVVAISPAYRGRDATPKDTLENIKASGEFTVSAVSYSMIQQTRLAAGEYPSQIDEFELTGFSKLPSLTVQPSAVGESSFILECKLIKHIELGSGRAGGNMLLGAISYLRVAEDVLDDDGNIEPAKLDQVGRLGRNWYTRANQGLFTMGSNPQELPMGFDALPESIKRSTVLSANDLAQLAQFPVVPDITVLGINFARDYADLPTERLH